jgi:hypothetical protein
MQIAMAPRFAFGVVILCAGLGLGCADGDQDDQGWTSFGQTTQTTFTTLGDDNDEDDDVDESGDSGDTTGDGDTSTTDEGDTSTTTTTEGDGDGDTETTTTTDTGDDCGNGVVDPGEGCDGANFNGQSCMGLGFSGGSLMCTASCQIDSSGCTNGGGGGQPANGIYSMCLVPDDCVGTDGCATVTMNGQVNPFDGYCTNFCVGDAECDIGLGGTAIPNCNNEVDPYCELTCTGGLTCPAGMECVALADRDVCY